MSRFYRGIRGGLAALALSAGATAARANEAAEASDADGGDKVELPVRGEIAGGVKIAALPDLGIAWRVELAADGLVLSSARPGLDLAVVLRPAVGGAWRWAVRRGALDLAELWPMVRAKVGAAAEGWSASGRIELAGEGTWSPESGPVGEVRLALREGWARSDELGVEISGVEFDAATSDLVRGALPPTQALRVAKIAAAGAELGSLRLMFGLDAARVFELATGEANFLGGSVRLRPFRMSLDAPAVEAAADVESLRLDQAARLLPWLLQSAQGSLRGRVELSWDAEKGLRMRDGGLSIVKADDAAFRLAPSPGLLTGKMPARFSFLPWRWASFVGFTNPAYKPLKEIELGREGLRIETFRVDFRPDGAGKGRTAAIHIVGKPTSGKWVEEVKLDLNFHGPWSEFLAFGLNNELSGFSFRLE